jgi:hypothetical protein
LDSVPCGYPFGDGFLAGVAEPHNFDAARDWKKCGSGFEPMHGIFG